MAKKAKAATKRTKAKEIPKSKKQMTGKDMRKIKGGLTQQIQIKPSKDTPITYSKFEIEP